MNKYISDIEIEKDLLCSQERTHYDKNTPNNRESILAARF